MPAAKKSIFYGELSLNGDLRHTKGAFLAALWGADQGFKKIFVPADSANEAAVIENIKVYPVRNLTDLYFHLSGQTTISVRKKNYFKKNLYLNNSQFDFADILGQEQAKRAMEIAAAGGHNVSKVGLIGGGTTPLPGEISLAHRGVLFLDEVPEFGRSTLESLRQPLEDGKITISRAAGHADYPSQFVLVAAANPCPCGYSTHPERECTCTAGSIFKYRKKLSGPLMDRIDLHIQAPPVKVKKLTINKEATKFLEKSTEIRKRVTAARQIQSERFKGLPIHTNSEMKNN